MNKSQWPPGVCGNTFFKTVAEKHTGAKTNGK